jgi:hypothetical protein
VLRGVAVLSGLILALVLQVLRSHDRVPARHGRQRLVFLASHLGWIGTAPSLQLEVLADRVVEITHSPTA